LDKKKKSFTQQFVGKGWFSLKKKISWYYYNTIFEIYTKSKSIFSNKVIRYYFIIPKNIILSVTKNKLKLIHELI